MKLSTKGRYGVMIMLELTKHHGKGLTTARIVAGNQGISEKYVEQIIGKLNKCGLVRSQRGAAGGYRLASEPSEISVCDILRATENGFFFSQTMRSERTNERVLAETWAEAEQAMQKVLRDISLADLENKCRQDIEQTV